MDIAKIRKKLKETKPDSQENTTEHQNQEGTEEKRVKQEERPSEEHTPDAKTRDNEKDETRDGQGEEKTVEKPEVKKEEFEDVKTDEVIEILTFSLLKEEFAFKISQLVEIVRPQKVTVVPQLPKYVLGVTSLRGKVIPVLDLKLKLSLTDKPSESNAKEKILIIKGLKGPIGATIDKVIGVVRVARNEIVPPPSHLTEAELKFIEGIAVVDKRFISIVNMEEAVAINFK
jgi:purine-binding chemotaxis protein CheW